MNNASPVLRDYQRDILSRLHEAWKNHRSVMVQMPTGTGKTHVLAAVVREALTPGPSPWEERSDVPAPADEGGMKPACREGVRTCGEGPVWIVAHRRELVSQIEETVSRHGISTSDGRVRVMSIQWLSRHRSDMPSRPRLIIVDEAHHSPAPTYKELWRLYPEALKLGMTATPCRMCGGGFTEQYDTLVTSPGISDFITLGHLSPFDYVSIRPDSADQRLIDSLELRGSDGDYHTGEMDTVLNRPSGIARLYSGMSSYARGKKGIVYAISISHARRIAAYYSRRGVPSAAIDSLTPSVERLRLVGSFRQGTLQVLVNVDVFSEGFDCPDVEFVQLARPTLSLSKYLQQVGRGLRRVRGKTSCIIIDHAGLYRRFGLPTAPRDWYAMFRGTSSPRFRPSSLSKTAASAGAAPPPSSRVASSGLQVVMSHTRLLSQLRSVGAGHSPLLSAWRDGACGQWGLSLGGRRTTGAIYTDVLDTGYGLAAVRLAGGRCGLVRSSGELLWTRRGCRSARFVRDSFLSVSLDDGRREYVDLYSLRSYARMPEIKRYGGIELLLDGGTCCSRTKDVYSFRCGAVRPGTSHRGFYLTLFDVNVPASISPSGCCAPSPSSLRSGYACLLEGDHDSYYWLCSRLADGSIIVCDPSGRHYHVEDGKRKRLIGHGSPAGDALCRSEAERLSSLAEERVRRQERKSERLRRRALSLITGAEPFKSGLKWGLRAGGRVVVPPVYRTVLPPVGLYCAVERNYSEWGVIALDGRVVVEPRPQTVSLSSDGTAVLTSVTGKKTSVRL